MTHVLLVVRLCVAWFCGNVLAMHLAVVLVMIGNETPDARVDAVGVGYGAIVGVVRCALTVITAIEYWTLEGGVGGVGDLAVGALVHSDGTWSRAKGLLTDM